MVLKIVLLSLMVSGVVLATDKLEVFQPDTSKIPSYNVWDGYYEFIETNQVDVLVIGNSKVHYGLRPKILSANLKANVYCLGSGGIRLGEVYYSLVEAFKSNVPKVVVVETYTILDFNYLKMNERLMSNQFKSFSARRDIPSKLRSTPRLFHPRFYFYAWSNTLRNHSQLYKEPVFDSTLIEKPVLEKSTPYMGEAVRFIPPLTESTLARYDEYGPGFNIGQDILSKSALRYLQRIDQLCRDNDVELMFLTVPMHPDHLKGYDRRKEGLKEALGRLNRPWINLQEPFDALLYQAESFEEVYFGAQHLTQYGATVTSYKLAAAIQNLYGDVLTDRNQDREWSEMLYGAEGYFEVFPPKSEDELNQFLFEATVDTGEQVELYELNVGGQRQWMAKSIKSSLDAKDVLSLSIAGTNENGHQVMMKLKLKLDSLHRPLKYWLYRGNLPDLKDIQVMGATLE